MFTKFKSLFTTLIVSGTFFVLTTLPALATPQTADDMWAAVDLDGISQKVIALLIVIIGIKLLFVAFNYIRSALARARG